MKAEMTNIPVLNVEQFKSILMKILGGAIEKGVPFSRVPAPFLWGAPGIGKSQAVFQVAEELSEKYNVKVKVTDVRLLLYNPVDLRGIPTSNEDKTLAVWLKPQIFEMDDSADTVNILFLDELPAAPQSVHTAAYQICLDRKIGEHRLPDNCVVIAAGNRATDQSVSYKMPKALCNRLAHFDVTADYEAWRKWAVKAGIDGRIIAYLAFDNSKLCVQPESSEKAYPTPRSWELANTYMSLGDYSESELGVILGSCVGNDTAIEFNAFCKGAAAMPPVSAIFEGKCRDYPKTHDVMYVLISSITSAVAAKSKNVTYEELDNLWEYVSKFPQEYLTLLVGDILEIKEVNGKLKRCYGFQDWISRNNR